MGAKLLEFYEKATKLGSIKATMRLAILTKISSVKAKELPDTPENIAIFQKAISEIQKEFKG